MLEMFHDKKMGVGLVTLAAVIESTLWACEWKEDDQLIN